MSRGPAVVLYGLSSNPTREVSLNDNHIYLRACYSLYKLRTHTVGTGTYLRYGTNLRYLRYLRTVGISGPWDSDLGRERDLDTGGRKPD